MKQGHIFTEGEIKKGYAENVIKKQLLNIGDVDEIIHHISSEGGDVYEGYDAYHALRQTGKKIKSIIEGKCMSIATLIALAGDEVVMLDPSRWMVHLPTLQLGGRGNADNLQSGADELRKIQNEMAEVYAARIKKTPAEALEMMRKETYLSAKEAEAIGFANKVIQKGELLPENERTKYRAVALGETDTTITTMSKEKDKSVWAKIGELFAQVETVTQPKAVSLQVKGGGILNVDGESPAPGLKASIDGQPANGEYELEDGSKIKCTAGVISEIMPAMPAAPAAPQETPEQKLQKRVSELEAQLQTASQAAANTVNQTQAQIKTAQEEKEKVVQMLGEVKTEFEKLKKTTFGDDTPPDADNVQPNRRPSAAGIMNSKDHGLKIRASRTFLADNHPYLEKYYHDGKWSQHGDGNGRFADGTRFSDYRSLGGPEAVSILETNFSYTWQGILTTDLFLTPSFSTPALSDLFTIDLGAKDKKRYNIVPILNKVLKPYTGCDQALTGTSMNITDKVIQLKPFQMYEGWCKDDFTDQLSGTFNHLAQEWLKSGNESFDPAGTPIDRIIVSALKDSLRRDVHRRVMFADNGSSDADYNQIDGLFTTLKEQSGAQNYCVYANKTNFGVGTLAADAAETEFASMYANSDLELKEHVLDAGKGAFWVTRSLWENYANTLRGYGAVTEQQFKNLTDGQGNLTWNGIPVKPFTIWDSLLRESDNPHTAVTRHIAILGNKDNFILGVEDTGDLNKIDSWFEKKDNKRYYRANMTFGVLAPIYCDFVTISY